MWPHTLLSTINQHPQYIHYYIYTHYTYARQRQIQRQTKKSRDAFDSSDEKTIFSTNYLVIVISIITSSKLSHWSTKFRQSSESSWTTIESKDLSLLRLCQRQSRKYTITLLLVLRSLVWISFNKTSSFVAQWR